MVYFDEMSLVKVNHVLICRRLLCGVLILVGVAGLAACGNKEKKAGQTLARVDGEEITVLQLNEAMRRANVPSSLQEEASKKLLESLIDLQLVIAEAKRNKIDRTPDVIGDIERAKEQIIAKAYLQGITARITKPSKAEINDYFKEHPEFFTQRKRFDMLQVLISRKDFNDELKSVVDTAKSLDEVVAWLDKHSVKYRSDRLSRTSADMPPEMSAKLQGMSKDKLFIVNEGDNTMMVYLVAIKDNPVTAQDAAPQIEQFLFNKKAKDVMDTEIAHLRSLAKIEYLNAPAASAVQASAVVGDIKPTKTK